MTSPEGTEPGAHEAGRFAVESDVDRQGDAFSWRLVPSLLVTSTLNPITSSLIATALVPIAQALSVPVGRTAILVSALYLASSIAQPTAGKLAEEFGPRRVSIVGILFVLLGGIIGGVAQDLPTLTRTRLLIGMGTSAGHSAGMVIIRRRPIRAGRSEPPGRGLGRLTAAGTVTHLRARRAHAPVVLHRALRAHPVDAGRPRPVTPRRGAGAATDGHRRRDRVAADLGAQPRPRPPGRRRREPIACVSRDRAVHFAHFRRRHRRRHFVALDHAGHHHSGEPDCSLRPGTRRTGRHPCRALPHIRLHRLYRVIDDHRN